VGSSVFITTGILSLFSLDLMTSGFPGAKNCAAIKHGAQLLLKRARRVEQLA